MSPAVSLAQMTLHAPKGPPGGVKHLRLRDYDFKVLVIPPPPEAAPGTTSRTPDAALLFVLCVNPADYGEVANQVHGESLVTLPADSKEQLVLLLAQARELIPGRGGKVL